MAETKAAAAAAVGGGGTPPPKRPRLDATGDAAAADGSFPDLSSASAVEAHLASLSPTSRARVEAAMKNSDASSSEDDDSPPRLGEGRPRKQAQALELAVAASDLRGLLLMEHGLHAVLAKPDAACVSY